MFLNQPLFIFLTRDQGRPYKRELSLTESYITTDGQSVSLLWNKAPIWDQIFISHTVAGLFMWGALSDERTGLSFTTTAGPCQRTHSRVRVPWDSRPYSTVSDSRLSFLSPRMTRRATVEAFDPASTRDLMKTTSNLTAVILNPEGGRGLHKAYTSLIITKYNLPPGLVFK
jgi:hypothetical protein